MLGFGFFLERNEILYKVIKYSYVPDPVDVVVVGWLDVDVFVVVDVVVAFVVVAFVVVVDWLVVVDVDVDVVFVTVASVVEAVPGIHWPKLVRCHLDLGNVWKLTIPIILKGAV
jgi:hypothetical protein